MRLGVCLIRWFVKFQQPNPFIEFNLSHLNKIIFNHSEGGWEGQNKSVPYRGRVLWVRIYQGGLDVLGTELVGIDEVKGGKGEDLRGYNISYNGRKCIGEARLLPKK